MKKIMIFLIVVIYAFKSEAQINSIKKHSYFIPQIALLNGDNRVGTQLQMIGGYTVKGWGMGAGAALDYYKFRSVPVFADLRKGFGKNQKSFAYANFGYNISWVLDNQHYYNGEYAGSDNGWYGDAGLGYNFFNHENEGLVISAGFTTKSLKQDYKEYKYLPGIIPQTEIRSFNYTLNRLAIRIGYKF